MHGISLCNENLLAVGIGYNAIFTVRATYEYTLGADSALRRLIFTRGCLYEVAIEG